MFDFIPFAGTGRIVTHRHLTAQRVHVCHPAVREEIGQATRDEPRPAASFALIVARMASGERYKGHDLLITIWPRVAAEVPQLLPLVNSKLHAGRTPLLSRPEQEQLTTPGRRKQRGIRAYRQLV